MNPTRQIRDRAGLTQQQLALAAGTSQSAVAAYEAGRKSPTLNTLRRIASAAGLEPFLILVPPMTREDRRSVHFHRALAEYVQRDSAAVIGKAKRNLKKLRALHPEASGLLREWRHWLDLPPDMLVCNMLSPDMHAREMRQVSPFSGILTAGDRTRILRDFQREEAP